MDLRRQLNDDRRRRFGSPGRTLALLCECGDEHCPNTVLLTVEEFDERRPGPLVHPIHDTYDLGATDAGVADRPLQ